MQASQADVFLVTKPFRAGDLLLKKGDPFIPAAGLAGAQAVQKLIEQRYLAAVHDEQTRAALRGRMSQVERVAPPPEQEDLKTPKKALKR